MSKLFSFLCAFLLAPLMLGLINRTKALFAGRRGQPLCQVYFDLHKLLKKGAVYSRTTTWIFRAGPIVSLASFLSILVMLPFGRVPGFISFQGDFILLAYLLGLARFFTVLAALDTGSSFEGMGASREITFSTLSEPVLFLVIFVLARLVNGLSLSEVLVDAPQTWPSCLPSLILISVALFLILLAENARIPVDDPTTHLELTMIHEVMVLDHSGPDLAFILFGSALKLWIMSSILLGILIPIKIIPPFFSQFIFLIGMVLISVLIGVVESVMARLRLWRIPPLLIGAAACSLFALFLVLRIKT